MAGGNLGDLWFNLGIRNDVSKELNKILKGLQDAQGIITKIDKFKLGSVDDKDLQKALTNAADYLRMLQQIEHEQRKIDDLKKLNQGVDLSGLKTAEDLLKSFKSSLLDLQKGKQFGGIDAAMLSPFQKTLRNTLSDVRALTKAFEKDNSLSSASSNAARLSNELERVKNKLADIRRLQSEGAKNGFNTQPLLAGGNSLRGVERRINTMLSSPEMLTEEAKVKALISDIQIAFTKATGKIADYNNEKKKSIQASRETASAEASAAREAKKNADSVNNALIALKKYGDLANNLSNAHKKGASLLSPTDLSNLETAIQRLQTIRSTLNQIKDGGGRHPVFGYTSGEYLKSANVVNAVTSAKQSLSATNKRISEEESVIKNKISEQASAARDLASAFNQVHRSASQTSQVVSDLKSLFLQGGLVFGAQQFANSIIQTGGEIVQQHIALRSILADKEKADKLFAQTQQLALQSPFKFGELNRDVKQLAAFGVEAGRLYDTTKRLADVSSGLGVSFERLGLAYGQVKARSWLDGKELRQFAYAGLPMLQKIADLYNDTKKNGRSNYTTSDVRKMITKRLVSFEDVDKVFKRLTDEGGQFYNMQFVLSETLLGKWNKMIDAWDIMLGKFAEGKSVVGGTLMAGVDAATKFILALDKLSPVLLSVGSVFAGKMLFNGAKTAMGFSGAKLANELRLAQISQLKLYAASQMTAVTEGKITKEIALQNVQKKRALLNTTAVKDATLMQSFAEGKISVAQLGSLASKKQISLELIRQMRDLDLISAKEARLIGLIRQEGLSRKGITAQMRLGAQGFVGKLGGIFSGGNLALLGVGVAMGVYESIKQFNEEMERKAEDMAQSAKQRAEKLKEVYERVTHPSKDDSLSDRIRAMKDVLYESGLFTNSLQDQLSHTKNINKQYSILVEKIKEAVASNRQLEGEKDVVANALKASKWGGKDFFEHIPFVGGLFRDDITENVKDYNDAVTALERTKNAGYNASKAVEDVKAAWNELAESNLPRIITSLRKNLHISVKPFKTWSNTVRSEFNNALVGVLNSLENADDRLKARLYAYAKIRTMHPDWDLNDPNITKETGHHAVAVWMRYYLDHYTSKIKPFEGGGSNEDDKKHKKDTELERIRNRVELYKRFYSEYQELSKELGTTRALDNLKESGDFKTVFGWGLKDVTAFANSLDELTSKLKGTTEERRKFLNNVDADKAVQSRKALKESIELEVKSLKDEFELFSTRYSLYKKILNGTGDDSLSANVAGIGGVGARTKRDILRDQMARKFNGDYASADIVLGMDAKDLKKYNKEIRTIREEWDKLNVEELKEAQNEFAEIILKHQSIEQKIKAENLLYDERIKKLKLLNLPPEQLKEALKGLEESHNDELSKLNWEKFKSDNNWGEVFGDLDNIDLGTINKMIDAMDNYATKTKMSVTETKDLYEALKRLTDRRTVLDPIDVIGKAFKEYLAARKELKTAKKNNDKDAQEKATAKLVKSFNKLSKAIATFAGQIQRLGNSLSGFGSSIGGNVGDTISGIGNVVSSLGSAMEQIKNIQVDGKGLTKVMGNVSAVLTVATTMIEMNKKLASILPNQETLYDHYAAKAKRINQMREAIDNYRLAVVKAQMEEKGWIGDDALQGLQKAYEIHGAVAENYYKKLYEAQEKYVASAAGWRKTIVPILGVVTAIASIAAGIVSFGTAGVGVAALGSAAIGAISTGAVAALSTTALAAVGTAIAAGAGYAVGQVVQSAIDSITYGDGKVDARSNMQVQTRHKTWLRSEKTQNLEDWARDNLGVKLFDETGLVDLAAAQAVLDSGATLVGETEETLKKLMELRKEFDEWDKQIKEYISSSFGSLNDATVNAIWDWLSGGKNALDSFRNYASDTFKNVAQDAVKTFLKAKVIDGFQKQLEDLYKAYSTQGLDGKRVIDEQQLMLGVASVAGNMAQAMKEAEPLAESMAKIISEAFKAQGYDIINGSNKNTGSNLVTGAASLSENTGDLIASYVNGIRASVAHIELIKENNKDFYDTMPALARSQVTHLKAISDNTLRNADTTDKIYSFLNDLANDVKSIKIH